MEDFNSQNQNQNQNQNQFNTQAQFNGYRTLPQVPNSTAVLVLGILSIVFCCFAGIALGIIALIMAGKGTKMYNENPSMYSPGSHSNLVAGRVCAIIGLIVSTLVTLYYLIIFLVYGAILSSLPWDRF